MKRRRREAGEVLCRSARIIATLPAMPSLGRGGAPVQRMETAHGQPLRAASDRSAGRAPVRAGLGGRRRAGRDRADPAAAARRPPGIAADPGQARFRQSGGTKAGCAKIGGSTTVHDGARPAQAAGALRGEGRAWQEGRRPAPGVTPSQEGASQERTAAHRSASRAGPAAGAPATAAATLLRRGSTAAAASLVRPRGPVCRLLPRPVAPRPDDDALVRLAQAASARPIAAARSASRRMRAQSPAMIASFGAIHEPPTIGTLGSAR